MSIVTPTLAEDDQAHGAQHLCHHDGCDRWGAWGYDPGDGVAEWWCIEHRPDRDPVKPVVEQNWVSDGNEG